MKAKTAGKNRWPTYEEWIVIASPEAMRWMLDQFGDTRVGYKALIAEMEQRGIKPTGIAHPQWSEKVGNRRRENGES